MLSSSITARSVALLLLASAAACGGSVASPLTERGDAGESDAGSGPPEGGPRTGYEGGTCNLVEIENPILTITDAVTGASICDATVAGELGTLDIYPSGDAGSCTYTVSGYDGSAPTFSLAVTAPNYTTATVTGLEVRYCGCGGEPCAAAQESSVSLFPIVDAGGPSVDGSLPDSGVDSGVDSGLPDAGPDSSFDAGPSACPATHPTLGGTCAYMDLYCEYGSDPNPYCNDLVECDNGSWTKVATGAACPSPSGTCASYATLSAGGSCPTEGQVCAASDGTCICSNDLGGLPISGGPEWACSPAQSGCPAPRPQLGTACDATSTSTECDYGACNGGVAESCVDGYWTIANVLCPA